MHRVFISDLHLERADDNRALRFAELLDVEGERCDELYILGDLVEMWIGDDDDSALAQWLAGCLLACNAAVYLMHGNRDFLFASEFSKASNTTLLPDPYQTADGLYLSHGDALCTDDHDYQKLRTMLRSSAWQSDILSKSLQERKAFGEGLRAQSRQANANKATNIMDVNEEALLEAMQESACACIVHGHTHRPGKHQHPGFTRFVTGAWERCGWLLRQQDQSFQLECFSLARRYGT